MSDIETKRSETPNKDRTEFELNQSGVSEYSPEIKTMHSPAVNLMNATSFADSPVDFTFSVNFTFWEYHKE